MDNLFTTSIANTKNNTHVLNKPGLTATEDVDKILYEMGYEIPLHEFQLNGYTPVSENVKQELMFSYGLTELEFDKAESLFIKHCVKGKFELQKIALAFPNNPLAERIQIPEMTNDDGDFLKFEEFLNIYQILSSLD